MDDLFKSINQYINSTPSPDDIEDVALTGAEYSRLIISLADSRRGKGFTEQDAIKVIQWARQVRIDESLLNLVLQGAADIDWSDEDNAPEFKITDLGNKMVDEIEREERRGLN